MAQDRARAELEELSVRLEKLQNFIDSSDFEELNYAEQYLLKQQLTCMENYRDILRARIAIWRNL